MNVLPLLYRKFFQYIDQISLDRLIILDSFAEWYINDFIVLDTYHHVALVFHDSVDGSGTQTACQDAVVSCRPKFPVREDIL